MSRCNFYWQVLDASGESLVHSWPIVIGIVHDVFIQHTSDGNLLRVAFESMRMVGLLIFVVKQVLT